MKARLVVLLALALRAIPASAEVLADTVRAARSAGPSAIDSAAAAAPAAAADTALELEEKTVKAKGTSTHRDKQVSGIRLQRSDLQKVAAAQGDPLKAVATLPGVNNQNDLAVRPFVRGGKAEETQVLWEGIALIQPYHFASIYSIFNMESLEDLDFYSGGFPARSGNALSGVLMMRARPSPLDSFRLYTDLSMLRGNAAVGVPIIKNRLGVSFSYQALWYDWVLNRGWDAIDILMNDSSFSDTKNRFRRYVDLPNFRDLQFGLTLKPSDHLTIDYTGIVSGDVFTVRDTKDRYYVNGGEVSPYYYDWDLYFGNPSDHRERAKVYDSLAVVSVDNGVHALRFRWTPTDRWEASQTLALQSQDWHVAFYDNELWTDSIGPGDRFAGYRTPGPSSMLFKLRNQAFDWRCDVRHFGDVHNFEAGLSLTLRSSRYETRLPRPVYETIVNGNVDALDALGYFGAGGFTVLKSDPGTSAGTNYLEQLPRLIRFDYSGEKSGDFLAAYASDEWRFDDRHRLTLGLRGETDSYSGEAFLSPRAAFFQSLGAHDELTWAAGLYSQADFPFHIREANPSLRPEKAFHANLEWTHAFSPRFRLECEAYRKNYYDLVTPVLVNTGRLNFVDGPLRGLDSDKVLSLPPDQLKAVVDRFGERRLDYRNTGFGRAGGFEISFFYDPNKEWNGWLSAEAGYSRRTDNPGEREYDFRLSRPWAFNWVNYFHMPSNYGLSLRARYAAGLPYTDYRSGDFGGLGPGGGAGDINTSDPANDTLLYVGPRNGKSYSAYARWDVRLSKDMRLRGHALQSYFEIWNAFNTPNFILADAGTRTFKFIDLNYPVPILFLGANYRW